MQSVFGSYRGPVGYAFAFGLFFLCSDTAVAEILRTAASVSATSQELMGGEPASVTSSTDELLPDASNLPLRASAELTSTDLDGALIAMGLSFSGFDDPTRLDQPNPEEFAIEAACYSDDAGVSYFVESVATETRVVRFGDDELDFATESIQEVQSSVFLSGAIVVWTGEGAGDLSAMDGVVSVSVTRDGGEVLFETSVLIRGDADGNISTVTDGVVVANAVSVSELVGFGLDAASGAVLESIENSGTLVVLILGAQEHTYTYAVEQDVEYELSAKLSASLSNAPGETGMAAALGRPFSNIAAFVEAGLLGAGGESVQGSINKAISEQSVDPDPDPVLEDESAEGSLTSPMCGAMGVEVLGIMMPFALVSCRQRFGWVCRGSRSGRGLGA